MAKKKSNNEREVLIQELTNLGKVVADDISDEDLAKMAEDLIVEKRQEGVDEQKKQATINTTPDVISAEPEKEAEVVRQKVDIKETVVDRTRLYEIHKNDPQALKKIQSITLNGYDAVLWFRIQELVQASNKHMTYGYSRNMLTTPIKKLLEMVLKHYGHYSSQIDMSNQKFDVDDFTLSN